MQERNHDSFFDEKGAEGEAQQRLMDMIEKQGTSGVKQFRKGARVSGTVARVGKDFVFIDIGAKNEAIMKRGELLGDDGNVAVGPGDEVQGYLVSDEQGELVLSRSLEGYQAGIGELREAAKQKVPVQGKVTGINKGGLTVKIMGHRAFCPASQVEIKYVKDLNGYFGKSLTFVISRIAEGGRNIVLSRIPLLEEDLEKALDALTADAESRTIHTGRITRIAPYGLFVDLGAVEGLAHISEVSWERVEKLEDEYSVGDEVKCVVLGVEKKDPLRDSKVSLSVRQAKGDPWLDVEQKFQVGSRVEGEVTRLADFGAFVRLVPGVEGLVHISEMSWARRVRHPRDVVQVGQQVTVTVLSVDPNKREIGLSLKDVEGDPWKDLPRTMPVGSIVKGTVASQARYGYFVDLREGVTGLLVHGNIASDRKDAIKVGDTVDVGIDSIDMDQRRIGLSLGMKEKAEAEDRAKDYIREKTSGREKGPSGSMSEFGQALKDALRERKEEQ